MINLNLMKLPMQVLKIIISFILLTTVFLKPGSEYCFAQNSYTIIDRSVIIDNHHCDEEPFNVKKGVDECLSEICCSDIKTIDVHIFANTKVYSVAFEDSQIPQLLEPYGSFFKLLNSNKYFENTIVWFPPTFYDPPITLATSSIQFSVTIALLV